MRIGVLGAGAWGTAIAVRAAEGGHDTRLWGRDPMQVATMRSARVNARYLPGIALPAALELDDDIGRTLAHAGPGGGLLLIATPMAALDAMLASLPSDASALWLCKGFDAATGRLGHEIARARLPGGRVGVLSGPSFAQEVAERRPTALVAASTDASLAEQAVAALHGETLRIYTSDDPVGVEVGGAVKNVIAIAAGICDGLQLGLNARAALLTRALAEITRLGAALGARPETFMGLSGLGDLVLTATGDLSRNRQVGLRLARGEKLPQIVAALGHVAEGVGTAPMVVRRAQAAGVDVPITEVVADLLDGRLDPRAAIARLMGRGARAEVDRA